MTLLAVVNKCESLWYYHLVTTRADVTKNAKQVYAPPPPLKNISLLPLPPPQKKKKRKKKKEKKNNQRHILRLKSHEEAYLPSRILSMVDVFPLKNFPRKQILIGNGGNSGGGGGGYKQTNKQTGKKTHTLIGSKPYYNNFYSEINVMVYFQPGE